MEYEMNKFAVASVTAIIVVLFAVGIAFATWDEATTTASVDVNQFLSVTITSGAPVAFGTLDEGDTNQQADNSPLVATIGSETNVDNIDVRTKANAASFSGPATLAVSNMEWSDALAGTYTDYTTSEADVCTGLSADGTCNVYHRISIPNGQTSGSYSVGIIIKAENVAP